MIGAAVFGLAVQAATAATWNLATDFSGNQGDNGWYYGYTESGGPFRLMTEYSSQFWSVDYYQPVPQYWTFISRNQMHGNGDVTYGGRTPALQEAVLRWVSPVGGTIQCWGHVAKSAAGGNGVDWIVRRNGTEAYARHVAGGDLAGFDYSVVLNVEVGDDIDFALDPHEGDDEFDGTAVEVTIEEIAPGTTWVLAEDYSGHQGFKGWYYGYTESGGPFQLMTHYSSFWAVDYTQPPPQYWTFITRTQMHGNGTVTSEGRTPVLQEAVIRWMSAVNGLIRCGGHVAKVGIGGNGVDWILRHNGAAVYSQYLEGNDSTGFDYSVHLSVEAGDEVDFVLNPHEGNDLYDGTAVGVTIEYAAATAVELVAWPAGRARMSCYPNPFNPQTTISFDLPYEQRVSLRIYDVAGRLVDALLSGQRAIAGRNEAVWRGRDATGRLVPGGVYFYNLEAGRFSETGRMAVIR